MKDNSADGLYSEQDRRFRVSVNFDRYVCICNVLYKSQSGNFVYSLQQVAVKPNGPKFSNESIH